MARGRPSAPQPRGETLRESLRRILREGPATARDLSRRAGIAERELADHLAHLERSAKARREHLVIDGPRCLDCDFDFPGRKRFTRPGHCPRCRSYRITLPSFHLSGPPGDS